MDSFLSKNSTRERIDPATEGKQRNIEARLEEIKLQNVDFVNVLAAEPIAGETQRLTNAASDTDAYVTVEAGGIYVFTSIAHVPVADSPNGGFYFGLADTQVAENVRWVCGVHQTILIKIPVGESTLHYATVDATGVGYLRRIG